MGLKTQRARVLQKPGDNPKGQEIGRTEQNIVQNQEESMEDSRRLRCLSIHILTSLFVKDMALGWAESAL